MQDLHLSVLPEDPAVNESGLSTGGSQPVYGTSLAIKAMAQSQIAEVVSICSSAGGCPQGGRNGLILCGLSSGRPKPPRRLGNTIHCVSISQTGFLFQNLTINFRNEVMRSLVIDGNFMANHIKLKRAADDVWLTDREGMMTARAPYKAHLAVAMETKEVKSISEVLTQIK